MKNLQKMALALVVLILVYLMWPSRSNYTWNRYGSRESLPDGYYDFNRMDMPGNDIKEMDGSRFDCARACNNTPGCAAFVRSPSMNHCWLKNRDNFKQYARDRNSFVKTSIPLS
jgi:hypothetical protein